ncbi:MAG TPA: N-acetyl-gamma-glutamyl-phosphate reductase [Polyangiaceae bacterium]|jgi:N-acetyl-gamma-glutamyl-phosphate reductase|nr:N-acetyl-gamma-glutamyl-phosphate reductase [Polyangiaceae bacterium]
MLKAAIIGAGGYTGSELVRLVHRHPELSLEVVAARDNAGKRLDQVLPSTLGIRGLGERVLETFEPAQAAELARRVDVAFLCLPHAASARAGKALYDAGVRVVDLSADFRLKSREVYEKTYGPHPAPELFETAVYGLPELHRRELLGAKLIAAPGCYPTSSILPLAPLLREKLVATTGIIVDSKSGVSGAGRTPGAAYHLPEAAEGIRPYKIAGAHRHLPEIEQELSLAAGEAVQVVFTPQLAPMSRGILTTAYARLLPGKTADDCRKAARALYGEGLVSVLDDGVLPDTLWVRGSARAHVAYALDTRTSTVIAMGAIDNLAKGASAQALQAFNVSMGWADETGLPEVAQFP